MRVKEFIPVTPEYKTTSERLAWDNILRALVALSEYGDDLDVYEAIDDLRDEELEDGLMMVFNYAVVVTVPAHESDELEYVMRLLEEYGIIEGEGGED